MDKSMLCSVQTRILHSIQYQSALLIGYSGGVDSSVLLHGLVELKKHVLPNLTLRAIYIHHGLSANADSWASHCQQQCDQFQVPLIIEKVTLDVQGGNIEEQARNARYQAFFEHLHDDEILCTAQHLDDQCETFFLALKRGSGPTGLSSMPEKTAKLLRPLLSISRHQIESYAHAHQLSWIEDESNLDQHYDRNFLRLSVLPVLNQRWPHFSQMVARSAELCQQQEQLIEELLLPDFEKVTTDKAQLSIAPLNDYSVFKRNAILRMWFKANQLNMPTRKQLELIWQTVGQAKEDANPTFILHDRQIRRYQHQLYLLPHYASIEHQILDWDLSSDLALPDNLGALHVANKGPFTCRAPNRNEQVTVRFHAQGQFHVVGRQGSRSIKKLWQEYRIAPWQRSRIPLVFYADQLIAAVGVFITQPGLGDEIAFTILPSSV